MSLRECAVWPSIRSGVWVGVARHSPCQGGRRLRGELRALGLHAGLVSVRLMAPAWRPHDVRLRHFVPYHATALARHLARRSDDPRPHVAIRHPVRGSAAAFSFRLSTRFMQRRCTQPQGSYSGIWPQGGGICTRLYSARCNRHDVNALVDDQRAVSRGWTLLRSFLTYREAYIFEALGIPPPVSGRAGNPPDGACGGPCRLHSRVHTPRQTAEAVGASPGGRRDIDLRAIDSFQRT
jgi:hypothetical protein